MNKIICLSILLMILLTGCKLNTDIPEGTEQDKYTVGVAVADAIKDKFGNDKVSTKYKESKDTIYIELRYLNSKKKYTEEDIKYYTDEIENKFPKIIEIVRNAGCESNVIIILKDNRGKEYVEVGDKN